MNKFTTVIKNPYKIIYFLIRQNKFISSKFSDKSYLKIAYRSVFGKKLDLEDPKTFNEKLQWLKLYDRNPVYTTMVDKYAAKKYVADIIGEEYIIPTLGVWDKFDDIDFDKLPNQFVLKCTHDSGGLVIVKDKHNFDKETARKKIEGCLKNNFYYMGREWPYKYVKPRIIAEKFISCESGDLKDYKFFCFNGHVKCFKIDFDRFTFHRANYFDSNLNLLKFGETYCPPDYEKKLEFPSNLKDMILIAEKLSNVNRFLRVDLYDNEGQIMFGEMTFFPMSGFGKFAPKEADNLLGSWLDLSIVK